MPHIANATAETEAEEIEITPAMIEAGLGCYFGHPKADEPSCADARILLADIYRAMARAALASSRAT